MVRRGAIKKGACAKGKNTLRFLELILPAHASHIYKTGFSNAQDKEHRSINVMKQYHVKNLAYKPTLRHYRHRYQIVRMQARPLKSQRTPHSSLSKQASNQSYHRTPPSLNPRNLHNLCSLLAWFRQTNPTPAGQPLLCVSTLHCHDNGHTYSTNCPGPLVGLLVPQNSPSSPPIRPESFASEP